MIRFVPSVPGWVVAWVIAAVGGVVALAVPFVSLPSDRPGLRKFQVPIDATTTVSQTFVMPAENFQEIDVFPAATAQPASGDVRFDLYDVTDDRVGLVYSVEVPAADVVRARTYRLQFPPIGQSDDQVYRLDVVASLVRPARGVGLWGTKGQRYRGGTMFINDRERWADLSFTTFAPAGRSAWRRLMDAPAGQGGVPVAYIVIGALAGYFVALGVVLRAV